MARSSSLTESKMELLALYVAVSVALIVFFQMHWALAMVVAPLGMLVVLFAVLTAVHLLWLVMLGIEKIGTMMGFRKSPLH